MLSYVPWTFDYISIDPNPSELQPADAERDQDEWDWCHCVVKIDTQFRLLADVERDYLQRDSDLIRTLLDDDVNRLRMGCVRYVAIDSDISSVYHVR